MSHYEDAVGRYFTAWNATDDDVRGRAVAAAWHEDGFYTDPLADVAGHEQLTAAIGGVHQHGRRTPRHRPLLVGAGVGGRRERAGRRDRCDHPGRRRPHPRCARLPGSGAGGVVNGRSHGGGGIRVREPPEAAADRGGRGPFARTVFSVIANLIRPGAAGMRYC